MGHKYVKDDEVFSISQNGVVPKPTQQDVSDEKVLKADGTWGAGGGGSGEVVDVKVNGDSVLDENNEAQITSYKEVTQSEYNALPESKLTDGVLYCIKDAPGSSDGFPPLIYSDEEREIGVWRDGKPLYQKTYDLGSDTSISYNSWTEVNATYPTNCELIVRVDCNTSGGTYASGISVGRKANGKFEMQTGRNGNAQNIRYFTIFYTKSSDTAGSGTWNQQGALSHHYSTSEKVIGTWIDGKPLYEKTFQYQNNTVWTNGKEFDTGLSNIDYCMIKEATLRDYNQKRFEMLPFYQSVAATAYDYMQLSFNFSTNKLILRSLDSTSWSANNNRYLWVTIQYTKTTD